MITITADELPRFMVCNGSRLLPASMPVADGDNKARDEGTAAHWMAVQAFKGVHTLDELIDRKAANGVFMTAEMAQHVDAYLKIARDENYNFTDVEINTTHDRAPYWTVNGRADLVTQMFNTTLRIVDFKYGWRIVEPENNWTLISHAIGMIKQRGMDFTNVELAIFQPRPYHPDGPYRSISVNANDMSNYDKHLNATLYSPSLELVTSPHCNKCHALATCPAARSAEMNAIDATDTVFSDTITNDMLAFNLDNLNRAQDMIKQRLDAFEDLAKHRIQAGQVVDNYSVKMGLGNATYKPGVDGDILMALTGKELYDKKLVTPAEAKRRGVDETLLSTLTYRPNTGIKLERVKANKKAASMFTAPTERK